MLNPDYVNFQELMLNQLGYKPSFEYYKGLKGDNKDLDLEISGIIKSLNFLPTICTEPEFGSCYGCHDSCDDYPHLSLWYDEKCDFTRDLVKNIVENLSGIPKVIISSHFSKDQINLDSYYERKISLNEIDKVQHLEISVDDSFFKKIKEDKSVTFFGMNVLLKL